MKNLFSLGLACMLAALLAACGGGDQKSSVTEAAAKLRLGDEFVLESAVPEGGTREAHYRLYGVTPQGELVEQEVPGLMDDVLVPLLLSETRNGKAAEVASAPQELLNQQRAFYQQLWDAVSVHEGSSDPQLILAEVSDLDARIVDVMDDSAASGLTLAQYLDFYDRLDEMPESASLTYAELNFQEMLSSVDKVSTLQASAPICPEGLVRVTSVSGLYRYCRESAAPDRMAVVLDAVPHAAELQKAAEVRMGSMNQPQSQSQSLAFAPLPWMFFPPMLKEYLDKERERERQREWDRQRYSAEIQRVTNLLNELESERDGIYAKLLQREQTIRDMERGEQYRWHVKPYLCENNHLDEGLECLKRFYLAENLKGCDFALEDVSCVKKLIEQKAQASDFDFDQLKSAQALDKARLANTDRQRWEMQHKLQELKKVATELGLTFTEPLTGGASSRSSQAPLVSSEPVRNFPPLAGELRVP